MLAYKFLRAGAVGPFSGYRWPAPGDGDPGAWVEVSGKLEPCGNGVHACRISDLPLWIGEELWAAELDGEVLELDGVLVARRGRLLRRVEEWNPSASIAFAGACAERAQERASAFRALAGHADDAASYAASASDPKAAAVTAYVAAASAAVAEPGGMAAERAWQARWLAERLGL